VGLAPTGKRRLFTAHTHGGHRCVELYWQQEHTSLRDHKMSQQGPWQVGANAPEV